MASQYKPTAKDMVNAYEVAYGELATSMLVGELYANVTDMKLEAIYSRAIDKVRDDLDKAGLL